MHGETVKFSNNSIHVRA